MKYFLYLVKLQFEKIISKRYLLALICLVNLIILSRFTVFNKSFYQAFIFGASLFLIKKDYSSNIYQHFLLNRKYFSLNLFNILYIGSICIVLILITPLGAFSAMKSVKFYLFFLVVFNTTLSALIVVLEKRMILKLLFTLFISLDFFFKNDGCFVNFLSVFLSMMYLDNIIKKHLDIY